MLEEDCHLSAMTADKHLGALTNLSEVITVGGAKTIAMSTEQAKKAARTINKFGNMFGKTLVGKGGKGRSVTPERSPTSEVQCPPPNPLDCQSRPLHSICPCVQ